MKYELSKKRVVKKQNVKYRLIYLNYVYLVSVTNSNFNITEPNIASSILRKSSSISKP